TFTVTVANSGNEDASDVDVTDTLPLNLSNLAALNYASCGAVTENSVTSSAFDLTIDALGAGDSCTITFTAVVASPLPNGTTITNHAFVEGYDAAETLTVSSAPDFTT